jgi:hypothetical protein
MTWVAAPVWQEPTTQEKFGGPRAQIDRERYSVAAVTPQYDCVFALRVQFEHRPPVLGNKDRSSPTMSDLHVGQRGMQASNPACKLVQKLQSLSGTDVDCGQPSPIRNIDETTPKDELIFVNETPPQIRQIGCVRRFAMGHSDSGKRFVRKRSRRDGHGELRLRSTGKLRQFEQLRIRGKQDSTGANDVSADMQGQRLGKFDALDSTVLEDKDTAFCSRSRQSADHLAGIHRSAGNLIPYAQFASVIPMDRRGGIPRCSVEFVDTGKCQVAGNPQIAKNRRNSAEYISETRQIPRRRFGKSQAACVSARASAYRLGLEYGDNFSWVKTLHVGGSRETAETGTHHCDVNMVRQRHHFWNEVHSPRRLSPANRIRIFSQRSTFTSTWVRFFRDAGSQAQDTTVAAMARAGSLDSFDGPLGTLGLSDRDLRLYLAGLFRQAVRPLQGSPADLFTSRAYPLEWINSTGVPFRRF